MGGVLRALRGLVVVGGTVAALALPAGAAAKDDEPKAPRRDSTTILVRFADPSAADATIRAAGDEPAGKVGKNVSIVKIRSGASVEARLAAYRSRSSSAACLRRSPS